MKIAKTSYLKAKKMGLLDPDSLTQNYDAATAKFASNQVLSAPVGWVYDSANSEFQNAGKTLNGHMPLPVNSTSYYMDTVGPLGFSNRTFCITANCKFPERAMQVINWLYSIDGARTIFSGTKDVNYVEKNGRLILTDATIQDQMTNKDFVVQSGITKYRNYTGLGGAFIDPKFGEPLDLFMTAEAFKAKLTPLSKDYSDHYGVSYPGEVMYKKLKYLYQDGSLGGFMPPASDEIKSIKGKIDAYLNPELIKLILSKDDATFKAGVKKIVDDLKNMGAERVLANDTAGNIVAISARDALKK